MAVAHLLPDSQSLSAATAAAVPATTRNADALEVDDGLSVALDLELERDPTVDPVVEGMEGGACVLPRHSPLV